MAQHQSPWDPARTQRGVAPTGLPQTPTPSPIEHVRYRLGSRLGQSGQVYEASSAVHAGPVAIKLFPTAVGVAPAAVGAFTREATRVADLRHPHVVQVMRAGTFADGTPFTAMERLSGQTLEQRINARGALPVAEMLPIVRGISSALSAAHATGVIHREIRADNVFIADLAGYEYGFAKVLDFGVSRLTAAARAAGRIVGPGTAQALAPEQRQGTVETADERTDQFSLAALAYRLLTGDDPPTGTQTGTAATIVRCPPEVEFVLVRAMNQRPEHRYDSIAAFFRALREALIGAGAGTISTPMPVAGAAVTKPGGLVTAAGPTRNPAVTPVLVPLQMDTQAPPRSAHVDGPTVPAVAPPPVAATDLPTVRFTVASRTGLPAPLPAAASARAGDMLPRVGQPQATSAVGSLTERFFVEGERQEANQWADSPLVEEDFVDARPTPFETFDSFDRVPKRRVPFIIGASVCVIGLAVTAWATGWFSGKSTPEAQPAAQKQPAQPVPAVRQPPADPPAGPLPAAPAVPVVEAAPRAAVPATAAAAAQPAEAAASATARIKAQDPSPEQAPDPLRGYAWSEKRRRLVRSRPAAALHDSGPPPAWPPSTEGAAPPQFPAWSPPLLSPAEP
ncbi:MAG: serine/threonine-protein kinase [Pseudomonadota bacterium]